jgi:hypothetical protein
MSDNGGWADPSRQGNGHQPPPGTPPPMPPTSGYGPPGGYGKPGVIPLRPLGVGEILDGSISTMRRHPGLVFGVSAVVALVEAALSVGASTWLLSGIANVPQPGPAATGQEALDYLAQVLGKSSATLGVTLVITVLIRTLLTGFLTVVAGKAVLGKPITFGEAVRELAPRLPGLIGVTVLYTLMVVIGSLFCLIPGIWLYALFSLASPALVLEHGRVGQSLARSRRLVQGSWWRVFGILLLTGVCAAVIGFVIQIPFNLSTGVGGSTMADLASASLGAQLLSGVGQAVAQTLVAPFVAGATALLYIDQRMRKEGMDIQLARAAGTV